MSALMAVERFADHQVSIGMPRTTVLTLLMRSAVTTPTLALAVGFAVRHADGCNGFLLAFIREPVRWEAETARVASEAFDRMWTALTLAAALTAATGYAVGNATHSNGIYSEAFAGGAVLTMLGHPDTRGNPMSLLRWTLKSTYELARDLQGRGFKVSAELVRRLLHQMGYSLQAPATQNEGTAHPDRDGQFRYLNDLASSHVADGEPVISVDTKKSVWVFDPLGSDEMLVGPAGRGRRLLTGACEPARSLVLGPSGPGSVAVSTNPRIV